MKEQDALRELETLLESMIATRHSRRLFLASLPVLLSACAPKEYTRYREGDNTGQAAALTPDEERKLTQEALPEIKKQYPALPNAELQSYISGLGQRVVRSNNLGGNPYHYNFTVVGVPYVNAFALPAGTVFVTAPLLDLAGSEAELAGVVGHEIGHIQARHAAERMEKAKREQKKSWLFGLGGGVLGSAAGFGLGKLLCPPKDTACLAKATALGAAAGAGGGLLVQRFAFMANSREDEMEADRIGFRTALAAGYSKDHIGLFYKKLQKMEEEHRTKGVPLLSSVTDALSTHPPSHERVQQMNQLAAETPASSKAEISSKDFDRAKALASEWVKRNPPKRG